jgi:large exoprotein involved in heme utilization and adhesion
LQVQAGSVRLDSGGAITATTESGDGGNIRLRAQELLLLRGNSNISTTAGTAEAGGNGGNINIESGNLVALEDSDITANAYRGKGGNIQISTTGFFLSADSNITASSR